MIRVSCPVGFLLLAIIEWGWAVWCEELCRSRRMISTEAELSLIQKFLKFLTSLPPRRLSVKLWPIFTQFQDRKSVYITSIEVVKQYVLRIFAFIPLRAFSSGIQLFRLQIATWTPSFRFLGNEHLGRRALKQSWSMVYCPCNPVFNLMYLWATSCPWRLFYECNGDARQLIRIRPLRDKSRYHLG